MSIWRAYWLDTVVAMNRLGDLGQFVFVEFHRTGAGIVDCLLGIAGTAKNVRAAGLGQCPGDRKFTAGLKNSYL